MIMHVFCFLISTVAVASSQELAINFSYKVSSDNLTTERIWEIDPQEQNPHRRLWVLERKAKLNALRTFETKGKHLVKAEGLSMESTLFFRGTTTTNESPWFSPFTLFSCASQPDEWFATKDGTLEAGQAAEKLWERTLEGGRVRLALLLSKISASTKEDAITEGKLVFAEWLKQMDSEWSSKFKQKSRLEEWQYYLKAAKESGECKGKHVRTVKQPSWTELIPIPNVKSDSKLLARAPGKLWQGLFSIRVSVNFGGLDLNGRFLIDNESPVSILSPIWLKNQGINPALVEHPGRSMRLTWSGGTGIGKPVGVTEVKISGLSLPFKDFMAMETELFFPPDFPATCCDGVLGADFLRLYAVELAPGPPVEVRIWDRRSFSRGNDFAQIEIVTTNDGAPVSSCVLKDDGRARVPYVRWSTGNEIAVDVHTPWQKEVQKSEDDHWILQCGEKTLASDVPITFAESGPFFKKKYPGSTVGMAILSRGSSIFDLSHGRLWLSTQSFKKPVFVDRSGLELEYEFNADNDRELKVKAIRPKTPASALKKLGLKVGSTISEIDSIEADDLDIWQIDRHLSGEYTDTVAISWKVGKTTKSGVIKVK